VNQAIQEWARDCDVPLDEDGLPDKATCEARGIRLTAYGLPAREERPGPPRPCMRCGVPAECPVGVRFAGRNWNGWTSRTEPVCDACLYLVMTLDRDFLTGGELADEQFVEAVVIVPTPEASRAPVIAWFRPQDDEEG
jgi:hypothetical protein